MRLVIKEDLKLYQEQGVAFKEIALRASSRSRNDQILLALSEYGIPVKTDGEQNNYLNPWRCKSCWIPSCHPQSR